MVITGIYDILQVCDRRALKGFWGGKKRLSITLYDQVINEPNADELAERILLPFANERGAYKRTYTKRFEEFDERVLSYCEARFSGDESLIVQDVGVSDGRTACDFFGKLLACFRNLSFFASDYDTTVVVIEKGSTKVTLSHTGRILECVWPPFVFNAVKKDSRFFLLNHLMQFFVERLIARPMVEEHSRGNITGRELLLFAPRALSLARKDMRFHLGQHDLLMPFERPSHVIRAMNVLNPTYFVELECCRVISNIHAGLLERGVLVTGSNQEAGSRVDGGIYQRTHSGFERVWQSSDGSPIDKIILAFRVH